MYIFVKFVTQNKIQTIILSKMESEESFFYNSFESHRSLTEKRNVILQFFPLSPLPISFAMWRMLFPTASYAFPLDASRLERRFQVPELQKCPWAKWILDCVAKMQNESLGL